MLYFTYVLSDKCVKNYLELENYMYVLVEPNLTSNSRHRGFLPDRLSSVLENQSFAASAWIFVSFNFISALMSSINFLVLILATMQSLSRTVGNVEFPIAASSGRQASLYNKSNASLWLRSTKQFRISFRKSSKYFRIYCSKRWC